MSRWNHHLALLQLIEIQGRPVTWTGVRDLEAWASVRLLLPRWPVAAITWAGWLLSGRSPHDDAAALAATLIATGKLAEDRNMIPPVLSVTPEGRASLYR